VTRLVMFHINVMRSLRKRQLISLQVINRNKRVFFFRCINVYFYRRFTSITRKRGKREVLRGQPGYIKWRIRISLATSELNYVKNTIFKRKRVLFGDSLVTREHSRKLIVFRWVLFRFPPKGDRKRTSSLYKDIRL